MSITFEYSFNATLPFAELVREVNRVLGTSFDDRGTCTFLGMPFVLAEQRDEDDRELNFSAYRFQLWNKTWDGSPLRRVQLESLVLAAFVLRHELGIHEGMLTYESQRLLARYTADDEEVFDVVEHIDELHARLDASV